MSRLVGVLSVLMVLLLAMGFAAANAGHQVTLSLGLFTLYRVPVTLVAFSGLFVGMLVMFATGIHSDLKVRRVLRERLAEDARREQNWIDRNQQDLFSENARTETMEDGGSTAPLERPGAEEDDDAEPVRTAQNSPDAEPSGLEEPRPSGESESHGGEEEE